MAHTVSLIAVVFITMFYEILDLVLQDKPVSCSVAVIKQPFKFPFLAPQRRNRVGTGKSKPWRAPVAGHPQPNTVQPCKAQKFVFY